MESNLFKTEKIFGLDPRFIKIFLPLIIEFVLFIVCLNTVILPKITEISEIRLKIDQLKADQQLIEDKKAYLMSIDDTDLDNKLSVAASSLLVKKDAYFLVNLVRKVAAEYGYEVMSFSISPGVLEKNPTGTVSKNQDNSEKILIKLTIAGLKEKYIDFLMRLENGLPILTIDGMEMTNLEAGNVKLAMNLMAYYQPEDIGLDYEKVTVANLKLSPEEINIFTKISAYQKLVDEASLKTLSGESRPFVDYKRNDPFNF